MIKHVWFDSTETLVTSGTETIHELAYAAFALATKQDLTSAVREQWDVLFKKHAFSRGAVFHSLGMPADFWPNQVASLDPRKVYSFVDPIIPGVLRQLREIVPISLFSNVRADDILLALGIEKSFFAHIITGDMLSAPKPALEGYYKMIELTDLPADEILYVGDILEKDILPAKKVGIKAGIVWSSSPEADYSFEKFEDILKVF